MWKDIVGYEGLYTVSDTGVIKSIDRTVKTIRGRRMTIKGRVIRPEVVHNGYLRVFLFKKGKGEHKRVASIVYEAFVGKVPDGKEIDHINGDKKDNRVGNLRACSHRENVHNPVTFRRWLAKMRLRKQTNAVFK